MRNLVSFALACLILLPAAGVRAEGFPIGDDGGVVGGEGPEREPVAKPTVTIDTVRIQHDTRPDLTFVLKFTFSVDVTGFSSGSIRITGAEKTSGLSETSASEYELDIETHADLEGDITVTVLAGAATNTTGESNDETNRSFTVDNKVPMLVRATVDNRTLVLLYHEELDEREQPVARDFDIKVTEEGTSSMASSMAYSINPEAVDVEDEEVTLTLSEDNAVQAGDEVTITYDPPNSGALRDERGNHASAITMADSQKVENLSTESRYPSAVRNLTAEGVSTTEIKLEWKKPESEGTTEISGYRIEVSKDGGTTWRFLVSDTDSPDTTYTHENLTPDTTLHYQVSAINGAGVGPRSNVATATTKREGQVPGRPTDLTATADGDDAIDLEWTAPADTGTSAITGYKIEYSSNGTTGWSDLEANTGDTQTTYTDSRLRPGTTRHYRVSAINATGSGVASRVANATTGSDPPDPPTGLTATAAGRTQIDLSWKAPADDGGSAVTGYQIEVSENGTAWSDLEDDTESTSTTYSHTGLDPVTTRHYRVSAINALGTGDPSNEASATTDANVPGAPTGLTATEQGSTQIDLSWTLPTDDGGSPVTAYRIEFSEDRNSGWQNLIANTGSTATTYSHTGLTAGSELYYRVSAINSEGTGSASRVATATTDATLPGAPTSLTATADGRTRINLIWNAPLSTGGAAISGYRIEISEHPDSASAWTTLVENYTNFPATYVHRGLAPGSTRYYRVAANNSAGTGPTSNVAEATTEATIPRAPTGLTATANGTMSIDLAWMAPTDDGGAEIVGYRIQVSTTNGLTWNTLVSNTESAATAYTHAGLEPASTRHYRVAAINAVGTGPDSNVDDDMTEAALPDAPRNLTANAQGTSQIKLAWMEPSYAGGVSITGYQIEVSEDGGSQWQMLMANTSSASTSYNHIDLDPASTRHYRVSAINSAGPGAESNVAHATTDARAPDAPTDLTALANGTSRIDLAWTAPAYDGGAAVTGYRIEVSMDRGLVWNDLVENTNSTAASFAHTGLSPATTRHYRVSAINRVGPGDPSNVANKRPPTPPCRTLRHG